MQNSQNLSISSIQLIKLPHHLEGNGDLIVMEGLTNLPFAIARVFVVRAPEDAIRGQHAHRACTQFLTCPNGSVEVECNDGEQKNIYILDHPNIGLLIPPSIWSQQIYKQKNSVLTVLCDRPYEEDDYIREYSDYLNYRNTHDFSK